MVDVANASLKSFAPEGIRADAVPPSEEPVFILNSSQLRDIISLATEPLAAELKMVNEEVENLKKAKPHTTATKLEDLWEWVEEIEERTAAIPQPLQRDRGEILRALLAANNGKMLLKEARQKMRLNKPRFSELLATMGDYIETKPYHLNKSAKVLILKSSA
jgi:hypothetical protein